MTHHTHEMATRSLSSRVSSLPGKVHEAILRQTFTVPADIRNGETPTTLHLLQVSKRTRAIHSKAYYGNGSVFRVAMMDLGSWLEPLADCDRAQIGELEVVCGGAADIQALWTYLGVFFARFVPHGGRLAVIPDAQDDTVLRVSFF